ncbi:MAG: D-alanyl-D-alanine carboxypeptidase/D-alanyl-D-alanine-endopeptidase [Candidatus Sumerlaeia bacterium]|nr:D-alanyl-D-alanine carboxypeptidase/D-alanyl-D-alanine-endopeptidase [Candidatus Sumerlaeia bacterium]
MRGTIPGPEEIAIIPLHPLKCRLTRLFACSIAILLPAFSQGLIPYTDEAPIVGDPLTLELVEAFKEQNLGRQARFSAYVIQQGTGLELVEINADAMLQPASLMKLVTSASALEALGPDRTFETVVELHGEIRDRRELFGHVVIRGGGDPSLGARFARNRNDVTGVLRDWARTIRRLGIREIRGNVFGDGRRYEGPATGMGWDPSEFGEWYSAEVSALNYNENTIDLIWRSGSRRGQLARWEMIPETSYVSLGSSVRTGPDTLNNKMVRYFRFAESNEFRVRGQIPPRETHYDFAAVHDPARYTAWLLREQLIDNGINVRGNAFGHEGIDDDNLTTQPLVVARMTSPPVRELLPIVNGDSQNLYAEVLFREAALESGYPGSFRGGIDATHAWLRSHRLQRTGAVIVDGSGLSPANRLSTRLIGQVMRHALLSEHGDVYRDSLAPAGQRSLRNRMNTADHDPLRPSLRGKTGYLTGVMALAGVMENKNGNPYIFVFLINRYDRGNGLAARDFLDSLPITLYHSDELP